MQIERFWLAPRAWRSGNWARFSVVMPDGQRFDVELGLQARYRPASHKPGRAFFYDVASDQEVEYDIPNPLFITDLRVESFLETSLGITPQVLRDLSLARLLAVVNEPAHLQRLLASLDPEDDDAEGFPRPDEWVEIELTEGQALEDFRELVTAVPRGFRITDAPGFWALFASAWVEASRQTRGPAKLIGDLVGVDSGRVRGWAKRARDLGELMD